MLALLAKRIASILPPFLLDDEIMRSLAEPIPESMEHIFPQREWAAAAIGNCSKRQQIPRTQYLPANMIHSDLDLCEKGQAWRDVTAEHCPSRLSSSASRKHHGRFSRRGEGWGRRHRNRRPSFQGWGGGAFSRQSIRSPGDKRRPKETDDCSRMTRSRGVLA